MKVKYSLGVVVALFAAGLLFAVSSEAKIDPKTIAGMWLFDEDEDDIAEDSSGNGNDGKLINGPEWDDGKFGSALEFDGGIVVVDHGALPVVFEVPLVVRLLPPTRTGHANGEEAADEGKGSRPHNGMPWLHSNALLVK